MNNEQKQVRRVVKRLFDLRIDKDFMSHQHPTAAQINNFAAGGPGPCKDQLQVDIVGQENSPWNKAVVKVILAELRSPGILDRYPPSDALLEDLIMQKLRNLRFYRRDVINKVKEDGVVENDGEVVQRVQEKLTKMDKAGRRRKRRASVSF